jgi:hypothetical protein
MEIYRVLIPHVQQKKIGKAKRNQTLRNLHHGSSPTPPPAHHEQQRIPHAAAAASRITMPCFFLNIIAWKPRKTF